MLDRQEEMWFRLTEEENEKLEKSGKRVVIIHVDSIINSISGIRMEAALLHFKAGDTVLIYPNLDNLKAYEAWRGVVRDVIRRMEERGVSVIEIGHWRKKNEAIWAKTKFVLDHFFDITDKNDAERGKINLCLKELRQDVEAFRDWRMIIRPDEDDYEDILKEATDILTLIFKAKHKKEESVVIYFKKLPQIINSLLLGEEYNPQNVSYLWAKPDRFERNKLLISESTVQIIQELENRSSKRPKELDVNNFSNTLATFIAGHYLDWDTAVNLTLTMLRGETKKLENPPKKTPTTKPEQFTSTTINPMPQQKVFDLDQKVMDTFAERIAEQIINKQLSPDEIVHAAFLITRVLEKVKNKSTSSIMVSSNTIIEKEESLLLPKEEKQKPKEEKRFYSTGYSSVG